MGFGLGGVDDEGDDCCGVFEIQVPLKRRMRCAAGSVTPDRHGSEAAWKPPGPARRSKLAQQRRRSFIQSVMFSGAMFASLVTLTSDIYTFAKPFEMKHPCSLWASEFAPKGSQMCSQTTRLGFILRKKDKRDNYYDGKKGSNLDLQQAFPHLRSMRGLGANFHCGHTYPFPLGSHQIPTPGRQ